MNGFYNFLECGWPDRINTTYGPVDVRLRCDGRKLEYSLPDMLEIIATAFCRYKHSLTDNDVYITIDDMKHIFDKIDMIFSFEMADFNWDED